MTMSDIDKIASILDEHIEKGLHLEANRRPSSKVEEYEETICKALSFNPNHPFEMKEDSPYYNPYAAHPMGGYYPYEKDTWTTQGDMRLLGTSSGTRGADGYRTVDAFYNVAGDEPMDFKPPIVQQSTSIFAGFRKSIDDYVIKGGPVPVGTTHTYADGQTYKKIAEGKWVATAGLESKKTEKYLKHKDPKVRGQASGAIEQHAGQKKNIQDMIKQRQGEQKVITEAKNQAVQAAGAHTHKMMSQMFDGKPPKQFQQAHEEHMKAHGAQSENPKEMLKQHGEGLKPKTHNVKVGFTHQGKEYSHSFEGVAAGHHQEAIEKVTELLRQKLPGAQLTRVHAETTKQPKMANV